MTNGVFARYMRAMAELDIAAVKNRKYEQIADDIRAYVEHMVITRHHDEAHERKVWEAAQAAAVACCDEYEAYPYTKYTMTFDQWKQAEQQREEEKV